MSESLVAVWTVVEDEDDTVSTVVVEENETELTFNELRDPFTGESLDLVFVITPEPATLSLLALGGLLGLRQRKDRA